MPLFVKTEPRAWRARSQPALQRFAIAWLTGSAALCAQAQAPAAPAAQAAVLAPAEPVLRKPASPPATSMPAQGDASTPPSAAHTRWQSTLAAFAKNDLLQHPGSDGVLFVGSSTIRLWSNLSQDFRQMPVVINRGFGGSTLRDCNLLARELVVQYRPKQVLLYAGDNDLAEGATPAEVLGSFVNFVHTVRAELPGLRISYISIKPSPLRAGLLPKIRDANALIANYAQSVPELRYIDIFNPMLDKAGQPRPELFLPDRLHLNETGYRQWQSVIAAQLPAPPPAAPAALVPAAAQQRGRQAPGGS
ncbi:MAG: lipolytic protein family [Polaromonas sp.]|nr:lipolytic protein family [Polaromonas sp.]